MLTIWGRRNSVNVQKAMWAVGEVGMPHVRQQSRSARWRKVLRDYRAQDGDTFHAGWCMLN